MGKSASPSSDNKNLPISAMMEFERSAKIKFGRGNPSVVLPFFSCFLKQNQYANMVTIFYYYN